VAFFACVHPALFLGIFNSSARHDNQANCVNFTVTTAANERTDAANFSPTRAYLCRVGNDVFTTPVRRSEDPPRRGDSMMGATENAGFNAKVQWSLALDFVPGNSLVSIYYLLGLLLNLYYRSNHRCAAPL